MGALRGSGSLNRTAEHFGKLPRLHLWISSPHKDSDLVAQSLRELTAPTYGSFPARSACRARPGSRRTEHRTGNAAQRAKPQLYHAPAPLPQPTRRWLCPQEAGAETAPPTPACRICYAGYGGWA